MPTVFANALVSVAAGITNLLGDEVSEVQHSQKFMEQVDSTEMRETRMVIGYSHARWRATRRPARSQAFCNS
jgi:hypothetical protein